MSSSKKSSKPVSRRALELAKWDSESFVEYGDHLDEQSFSMSQLDLTDPKSPKSPKPVLKSSRRFDSSNNIGYDKGKRDSSGNSRRFDSNNSIGYDKGNRDSSGIGEGPSETEERDASSKKKLWFWKRKKSYKSEGEEEDEPEVKVGPRDSSSKSRSKSQKSQRDKNSITLEDCETEFHEVIRDHDWVRLEGLLKEYDPTLYKKKSKSKSKPSKKLKILKHAPEMPKLPEKLRRKKEDPETPISPLLALDKKGRTPLHLCCIEPTPSKLLLRAMICERNAASVKDKAGNLPIHYAIENRRAKNVIERLIRGYYQGSWAVDGQNRTPLMIAIEAVIKKQQEEKIFPTKTYWGFPVSPEDIRWQEDQERLWEIPKFLVQNRIDRRKRLLTLEYTQVLVALNKCAPPELITNILATGRKCLVKEEVAQKVLFLLISRQYPIALFKWFMQVVTTNFIKEQQDFTGCGVVAAHFRVGCIKHVDTTTNRERDSFAITMKKLAYAKKNRKEFILTPQYTEWWEKLKLFINLWATHFLDDNDETTDNEKTLLHNALTNSDAPPLLLQLLSRLYPESIVMNHPKVSALPIHFACRQWKFREYPPRRGEKIVTLDQICEEFLSADETQTRKRTRDRLPLHHAITSGKSWEFVKPLVTHDPESLLSRDPLTCLRPFQLAALKMHYTFDIDLMARRQYLPSAWNNLRGSDRDRELRKLLHTYDLKQLDLVYELLRHSPTAISKILSAREILLEELKKQNERLARENLIRITRTKLGRILFRLGNVEGHFIGWCYENESTGEWIPHPTNFPMVKEAIMDGFVPRGMDKWWRKLKFWLWQDCPWDNIPRRADFLLHCALCNPKVSPWIVELILECFPRSATIPLPNSDGCYPLHIACITDTYIPLPFEFPNERSVIEMVAKSFRESILLKWNDTLPLHYAIMKRKEWSEIRLMAEDEPVSLAIPDSENDFFPFQLMALHKLYTKLEIQRFVNIAMISIGKNEWGKTSADVRTAKLKEVLHKHETDSVGCIFELLKRNPMLVHVGTGGDGIDEDDSTNKPLDRISIEDYLTILDSNSQPSADVDQPSSDIETPSDLEEESALLDSWLSN